MIAVASGAVVWEAVAKIALVVIAVPVGIIDAKCC